MVAVNQIACRPALTDGETLLSVYPRSAGIHRRTVFPSGRTQGGQKTWITKAAAPASTTSCCPRG